MKLLLSTFLSMLLGVAVAQTYIEPCKFGQPLVQAVRSAYSPNQTLGYSMARDTLYATIDNDGLNLSGVYSNFTVTLDPNIDPSVSAFQGGSGINAEHVYPQSKGASSEPQKSDMHNIHPSRVAVNSARGSCPFGEIVDSDTEKWFYLATQLTSIPATDKDLYSEKDEEDCVFEPRESAKGDIARTVFYFYTIYQNQANNADPNFFHSQKATLLQWHEADPVTPREVRRDSLIALHQGNHNPFVLDSTLAKRAYFMADATYMTGDTGCIDVVSNIVGIEKEVNWVDVRSNVVQEAIRIESMTDKGQVQLYDVHGRLRKQATLQQQLSMNITDLPIGQYFLRIQSQFGSKTIRVLKIF